LEDSGKPGWIEIKWYMSDSNFCWWFLFTVPVYSAPRERTHTHKHTHLTRNYMCGHIYQDFVRTTNYYTVFYHFNNS